MPGQANAGEPDTMAARPRSAATRPVPRRLVCRRSQRPPMGRLRDLPASIELDAGGGYPTGRC